MAASAALPVIGDVVLQHRRCCRITRLQARHSPHALTPSHAPSGKPQVTRKLGKTIAPRCGSLQYPPAVGRRSQSGNPRPRNERELGAWLRNTLHGEAAFEIVSDELAHLETAQHTPATDVMSAIKAVVLNPEGVRGVPMELIRRDASPSGLALSRRALKGGG